MKSLYSACFIILVFTCNSFAELRLILLDEAIKDSDLIIIGTLKNISEKHEGLGTYGKGTIVVDEFIAGQVSNEKGLAIKSGDKLILNYVEYSACVMGSHKRIENEKGIFILTLNSEKEIESKDFRSIESLPKLKKLLKKGIRPKEAAKTVKILNNTDETLQIASIDQTSQEESKCLYSDNHKTKERFPFSAFLVILASISLYYLLYRSKFKIR